LQSLILTNKEKMLLTPTYYVFDLFKVHQDAASLPVHFSGPSYTLGNDSIPAINVSASKDRNGTVHMTLVNLDPRKKIPVTASMPGFAWKKAGAVVLSSGKFTDINSFEEPEKIKPAVFNDYSKKGQDILINMPPMSILQISFQ
jgi:alpha-N-arabinofuranosidase